eukprot:CAMPEP_0198303794 /NCGR_PEP_ID=MMETSP1449-20131203/57072_1 /TAXON_ID=420275 /ORGANISM="Attheya septentrionalis, Strain CCMP2084" /LENGTH=417 /DNA_ID=CAMNT_0044006301 /DNA_START=751 /DNA_END=2002 /DNA_ORIENTATION=-
MTTPLDKKMHRDIYLDLLEVTAPYFEPHQVQQILPDNLPTEVVLKGTQGCEAVNTADCIMAPKHQHCSSTCSLEDRSATMVASHNLGETAFYNSVTKGILGLHEPLNANQLAYLEYKWGKNVKRRAHASTKATKRKRTEQSKSRLKATIVEKMVEEAAAEQFGKSYLDAHKYTMSNLTVEEIDEIKKEKAKLLKKENRPCSSCGVKGHWDKRFWMCINNENNKNFIDIADGKIVDDRKSKKPDDKKKIKSKSKKPPKKKAEGLASFNVKQLKEKLKSLGLPHSGNKPDLIKRLTNHAAKTTTSVTPGSTSASPSSFSLSSPPPPPTTTAGHNLKGLLPLLPPQYVGDQHSTHNIYCVPATEATKVPATVTDTPLLSLPPNFQQQSSFHGDLTTPPPPEQEAESEDESIVSFIDTTDS